MAANIRNLSFNVSGTPVGGMTVHKQKITTSCMVNRKIIHHGYMVDHNYINLWKNGGTSEGGERVSSYGFAAFFHLARHLDTI
jgi:hypothetical protein